MPLIETKNLSYTYAGASKPILHDISLTVEKGEFLLVTGATGSGKTTLCRCLNGIIPHHYAGGKFEGSVTISGLRTSDHSTSDIASRVGYVLQNPENQLFALTVEKNVSFGLENAGMEPSEMRSRVDWALGSVGMLGLRKRAPYDLSGGQQQRVAIASALALKPQILIMDEPAAYLDPLTAKSIYSLASELNRSLQMTIILVEHRLEVTAGLASRMLIVSGGMIARDGEPSSILLDEGVQELAVTMPPVISVYRALGRLKSKRERVPLDPVEAGRTLGKKS